MTIIDILISLLIFFWSLVYIFYFPYPLNWILMAIVTEIVLIYKIKKGKK